jgi:methionine-rich copper-binding protein CopC
LKRWFVWLLLCGFAASCAIPEPPPGGPEDKTAPEAVATMPVDGTAGISTGAKIEIEFSEKLSGARFDRFVEFSPDVKIAKTRWKGRRLFIEPADPLRPDTTYVVRIRAGFTDAHNVRSERGYEFGFATSASVDTGTISGRVYFRRKPAEKGVVRLFVLPRDSSFVPEAARPDREGVTAGDGTYKLKYLPQRSVPFLLWAYSDDNAFDRDREVGALFADTLSLDERTGRLEDVDIWIVDPKEPGLVAGRVVNATGVDSLPITVTLAEARDTIPPTYWVRADAAGRYKFENVLKGRYVLHAFLDMKNDSLCGTYPCPGDSAALCDEYCAAYPDSVIVSPGDELRLKDLRLETGVKKEE